MKAHTSTVAAAVFLIFVALVPRGSHTSVLAQSQVASTGTGSLPAPQVADDAKPRLSEPDSVAIQEGLEFYLEARPSALAQIFRLAAVSTPAAGGTNQPSSDQAAGGGLPFEVISKLVMSHLPVLSTSRLALVSYSGRGLAVLIQTGTASEATDLAADLKPLADTTMKNADHVSDDVGVRTFATEAIARGNMVIAGAPPVLSLLAESDGSPALNADPQYIRARTRFSSESFFGFLKVGGAPPLPSGASAAPGLDALAVTGILGSGADTRLTIALGGSLQGNIFAVHAIPMLSNKATTGILASILSSTRNARPMAAGYAPRNTDLFIDVSLDWQKLYDGLAPLFSQIAGAAAAGQPRGGHGNSLESQLGFSIKNDLLPAIGNEVAVSITFPPPAPQAASQGTEKPAKPPVQFCLVVAVRNPAKLETMVSKIIEKAAKPKAGAGTAGLSGTVYRGVTIKSSKQFSYAITQGFLIGSGTQAGVRQMIEEHALGTALGSVPDFMSAMGPPRPSLLQVYMSGSASSLIRMKASGAGVNGKGKTSPIGIVIVPDAEGMVIEARVPAGDVLSALAGAFSGRPASGAGTSNQAGGRSVPKMTDDDVRARRP